MPVVVTTLLALGSYAATVLARRRRRRPGDAPEDAPAPPAGARDALHDGTKAGAPPAAAAVGRRRDAA